MVRFPLTQCRDNLSSQCTLPETSKHLHVWQRMALSQMASDHLASATYSAWLNPSSAALKLESLREDTSAPCIP